MITVWYLLKDSSMRRVRVLAPWPTFSLIHTERRKASRHTQCGGSLPVTLSVEEAVTPGQCKAVTLGSAKFNSTNISGCDIRPPVSRSSDAPWHTCHFPCYQHVTDWRITLQSPVYQICLLYQCLYMTLIYTKFVYTTAVWWDPDDSVCLCLLLVHQIRLH